MDRQDRIPRPQVDENINQSDWLFLKSQWERYVRGTGLLRQSTLLHIWEACSEPLQRSLHYDGAEGLEDPDLLLGRIKQLAVKKHNNLVNIIEQQRLGQQHDETVAAYTTRLNDQASLCDLNVVCPDCDTEVGFKEKTVMYQLVRGLADKEVMERVLQAAAQIEGGELSLVRIIKLCKALKMGKQSQHLVNSSAASLNRI